MIDGLKGASAYDRRSIRENLKLVGRIFLWMFSLTFSDKAALHGWWSAEWITVLSIVVTTALGLWVIHGYRRLLQGMDDLQRKIQLEALSMGFGLSAVACVTYMLLVTWGYITDEEVSDIFVVMCVTFSAATLYGVWKYR